MFSGQSMGGDQPAQAPPEYPDLHDVLLLLFVRDQMKKAPEPFWKNATEHDGICKKVFVLSKLKFLKERKELKRIKREY
jgi:hypothetical protein